jgi:hypothetical protein
MMSTIESLASFTSTVNALPWLMVCHLLVIEANMMSTGSRVASAGTVNALPSWRDVRLSMRHDS